jgi:hypothetical protein
MAAFLKTALFFLLAATSLAKFEQELAALQSQRHPLLAPLSDIKLTQEQGQAKVESEIDEILMLSSGKSWKGFWLELMGKSVKYPFEESEKGLNEATVTEQITAVIDSSFPAPSSISATAEPDVIAAYFASLPAIYVKIERLIKMELITQFAHSLNTEEKLKFKGEIIAKAEDQIIAKANELVKAKSIKPEETVKAVHASLNELKNSLMNAFLPRLTSLLDLYKNGFLYLKGELSYILILAQLDTGASNDLIVGKYKYILESFASIALIEKKLEGLIQVFKMFTNFIVASRRGSSLGSIRFKEMIPQIIGLYVSVVSTHAGFDQGYDVAREYLNYVSPTVKDEKINAFFTQMSRDENGLPDVRDPEADTFVKESLKTMDILKRVNYPSGEGHPLLMWWMQASKNFGAMLEVVSGELMDLAEYSKLLTSNYIHSFDEWKDFYLQFYDMIMGVTAEKGSDFGTKSSYINTLINHIQASYDQGDKFVREYYLLLVVHVLYFRGNLEGEIVLKNFSKDNSASFDKFKKMLSESDKTLYFTDMARYAKTLIKTLKITKQSFVTLDFIESLIGIKLPYSVFRKASINQNVQEKEVLKNEDSEIEKKKVGADISDGKANNKLNDIEKKAPIVIPQKEEPVVIPQPQVEQPIVLPQVQTEQPIVLPQVQKEEPIVIVQPKEKTPKQPEDIQEPHKSPLKQPEIIQEPHRSPAKEIDQGVPENKITVIPVEEKVEPVVHEQPEEIQDPNANKHQPDTLKDIQEETRTPTNNGSPIEVAESPIKQPPAEELENLIDVVKGSLDPVTLEALKKNPDLIDLVEKIQVVVDPETGDETHYHYIQVVPKDSACYDSIFE